MTDPNINASAQSVSDKLDGIIDGTPLSYREVEFLVPSQIFGLSSSYPFPEGQNGPDSSALDQVCTLAKVLTRTWVGPDGKTYDIWDAVMTLLNAHLAGS
jgi:hypothetical protein